MKKRNKIKNIFLTLISSLLGLIICELILAYPIYYFLKPGKTSFYNRESPHYWYKVDPVIGFVPKENLNIKVTRKPLKNAPRRKIFEDVQTNKYGFRYRDDLTKEKPIGEIRIFSLGGSTTQGGGIFK